MVITNHSDALSLEPRPEGFVHPHGGESSWEIADVPEHGEYPGPRTVLAPGGHDGLAVKVTFRPEIPVGEQAAAEAVIGFTDAAGHRWRRIGSSLLVRVRADSPTRSPRWWGLVQAQSFRVSGPDGYGIDQ